MAAGAKLWLSLAAVAAAALVVLASPIDQPPTVAASMAAPPGDRIPLAAAELQLPDASRHRVRSVLNIPAPMKYGEFRWDEAGVPDGEMLVRVDLRAQTIAVFRGGHEIGAAVILYGADGKPTPGGLYPIIEKKEQHRSNLYDAEMPYMLRLTNDGIAIHASEIRSGRATHGCIGVPEGFARALFRAVAPGDRVVIVA